MLFRMTSKLLSLLRQRSTSKRRQQPLQHRVQLCVELLEKRELLALLLWVGPFMGDSNWNEKQNWRDIDLQNGAAREPKNGDELFFDPDQAPGTNTPSTDNLHGLVLKSLTL